MRPAWLLALGILLSGCAASTPAVVPGDPLPGEPTGTATSGATTSAQVPPAPGAVRMDIHGTVVDQALRPLAANVTLVERDLTVATGPSGTFRFDGVVAGTYFLRASAAGHREQTLTIDAERSRASIRFVLEAIPAEKVHQVTSHFHGLIECALEAAIISPSCDSIITAGGGPALFQSNQTAVVGMSAGWRTVVADVVFDAAAEPGLDGLRATVRGTRDAADSGSYQQYGRFNDTASFTFRLEPGSQYPDGTEPVPGNTTAFEFAVYPQSHLWHATCDAGAPPPCFLGVGAGTDVEFDLYVTVFYGEPAPAGWSFQE